ncbi:MAG: hypothetical protein ISP90_17730 [Nevskia sp.]|nr:hypothetical protein [Nevskia sp.]
MNRQEHSGGAADARQAPASDGAFGQALGEALRASEDQVDHAAAARLRAARARAVEQAGRGDVSARAWRRWAVPAAFAAALALLAVLPQAPRHAAVAPGGEVSAAPQIEAIEQLGADDSPVADDADPDFVQWLQDTRATAQPGA